MKTTLTVLLLIFGFSASAQSYTFPNIEQADAEQITATIDTLFADIGRGHVRPELLTGQQAQMTHEMLEYLKMLQGDGMKHGIINCYPVGRQTYRVLIACSKADVLQQMLSLDIHLQDGCGKVNLPLSHDTRNWSSTQVGSIRYYYDHDFDLKAAQDFDKVNHRIAEKLGLTPDSLDFYLADNYQQIMQWLGITYDKSFVGKTRDGFDIEQTIFAIQHNEDYAHDLVHYYVYKVRKGPRNPYAEEGVAYYWGNAYYPDAQGQMITLNRLKTDLRAYLIAHPGVDLLAPFRQNQRGLFGPAKEISMRSTLSGIIAEYVEKRYGVDGVLKLLNCGAGEENYFAVTKSLAGIDASNFNVRIRELLGE